MIGVVLMHGKDDDEERERQRQALADQGVDLEDLVYGKRRKSVLTGQDDKRHDLRESRHKVASLRMRLRTNEVLRRAMKEAGYNSFPKFFELMFALYLKQHPVDDTGIPSEEDLTRQYLAARKEQDGK